MVSVPRAVRFPVEMEPPPGFDPAREETWPQVEGRLEYVGGRLWFTPPCGDVQQVTVTDVVTVLGNWVDAHDDFVVGANEAGIYLDGEVRGADAAVWRKNALSSPPQGGFQRAVPVLAVEVAGRDQHEKDFRDKTAWYLDKGVDVVWLVLPASRAVVVLTRDGSSTRHGQGESLRQVEVLPDLAPAVARFFRQLDRW